MKEVLVARVNEVQVQVVRAFELLSSIPCMSLPRAPVSHIFSQKGDIEFSFVLYNMHKCFFSILKIKMKMNKR